VHVTHKGMKENRVLMAGKLEGTSPLGEPRQRWEDNNTTGFKNRKARHRLD